MTPDVDWHRPHPLTVIVMVGTFLASNAWPLVFIVIAGGGGIGFDTIALAVGGATVGWGALGWYMTGYVVTDDAVHHRSGVLNRQTRAIPLDRIQQVSVGEPVLARVVGLAVVRVAEASADGDVEIRYLARPVADELTERLRRLAREREARTVPANIPAPGASSLPPPPPPPPRPATSLHTTDLRDLLVYQAAAMTPVLAILFLIVVVAAVAVGLSGNVTGGAVIALAGSAVVLCIPLPVLLGTALQYGNFALERGDRSLTMDAGLLSRRQVEVRPDRIQTITVTSGPVARRLDLHEVKFSAATGKAVQQQPMVHLAPAIRTSGISGLVRASVDVDAGFQVDLEPVSRLTIRRTLVRSGLLYLAVGLPVSVVLFSAHPAAAVLGTALWWAVAVWYARHRFVRLGLSLDEHRLVVRSGVLQHRLTQVPVGNVQSVSSSASFFQRRLAIASVRVTTAGIGPGNSVWIPDLPRERAGALCTRLAAVAATTPWELRG